MSYDGLRFAFEDRERNLWVGSSGGGLMHLRRRTFQTFGFKQGLPEQVVKTVVEEAPGRLLIGTYGRGAVRVEGTTVSRFRFPDGSYLPGYTQALLADRASRVWIGTFDAGLVVVEEGMARTLSKAESGGKNVTALFQDSRGAVWIGGSDSVCFYENGRFGTIPPSPSAPTQGSRCFSEDPETGRIWMGNAQGLFFRDDGAFQELRDQGGRRVSDVLCLHCDSGGTLWIGTVNAGLYRLRQGLLSAIDERHGLVSRTITAILDDRLGHLWLGSNRGIVRASREALGEVANGSARSLACETFGSSDGLASVECPAGFQPTAARDSQGRLWFATLRGVAAVDPAKLVRNPHPPPVVIERLVFYEASGIRREILDPGPRPIVFPPGSFGFEIHYAGLSYSAPEKMRFAYLLDGLSPNWVDAGNRRQIDTQTLQAGDYRLRIKAANNDGVWNEAGASLAFTVEPFFYQTLPFRAFAVAVTSAAVGLLVWRATRARLLLQIERLEQRRTLEGERARLASVLEATSDFVGFSDPEGRILYVNHAGRRLVGMGETADLRRSRIADFHPNWAADRVLNEGVPAAQRDGIWSGETALLHRDGREIPISQVIVAHRSPEGTVSFLSTIARDISERKRAEDALKKSEASIRAFMDAIPEPSFLMEADGTILVANGALARSLGTPLRQLIGVSAFDQLPPEVAEERRKRVARVLESGRLLQFEDTNGGRHFINFVSPVAGAEGEVSRIAVFAIDITEEKRAELALRASEERLRACIEHTPNVAVQWYDSEGRILFWNRASERIFGWKAEEAIGKTLDRLILTPKETAVFVETLKEIQAKGRPVGPAEYHFRRRDGSEGVSLSTMFAIPFLDGGPCFVCMDVDLTERKRAEEERIRLEARLRDSQKMEAIGKLAGGIAHDFNNVLTAISGNARLAGTDLPAGHPVQVSLAEIAKATTRAANMVRQILAFSRHQEAELKVIHIRPVIEEAVNLLRATMPAMIEIRAELGRDLPPVLAEATQIHQVLMNLGVNARDAMRPTGGVIEILLAALDVDGETSRLNADLHTGRYVLLSVSDTGCGMDPATLGRVFDPFFTTKAAGEGTGLGLASVHGIVMSHGGAISVRSAPGEGTTFDLYFPACAAEPDDAPAKLPPPADSARGRDEHILYVDDEEPLVFLAARMLKRMGYRVTGFTRAEEALAAFQAEPDSFDVVITDLTMPGMSGSDLARELLKVRPRLPIVMATGYLRPEESERVRQIGVRQVITKPDTVGEFGETLRRILNEVGRAEIEPDTQPR